jgi:uncharacterized protein (DUF1499 family)
MSSRSLPASIRTLGYAGAVLLALLPISVLVVRAGAWQAGLALYALTCLLSALVLLVALVLLAWPRFRASSGAVLTRALLVLPGTLLLLSVLATRGDYPPIHDITTDLEDPPVFVHAPELRGSEANTLAIKPESLERQAQAYPDLETLHSTLPPQQALERAADIAEQLGWELVYRDAPTGRLEAVDTTAIMGFRDDIVIRVSPRVGGSDIDLRSVSRVGVGDMGANAARIRAFLTHFTNEEHAP